MFAKGPMPGYSPREEVLKLAPKAQCQRRCAIGITGYVVSIAGKGIASAASAREAWEKALAHITRSAA
jgi:hypothetical protein